MPESGEVQWLLLIHQIPPEPTYFRVKIWRRLQKLGGGGSEEFRLRPAERRSGPGRLPMSISAASAAEREIAMLDKIRVVRIYS